MSINHINMKVNTLIFFLIFLSCKNIDTRDKQKSEVEDLKIYPESSFRDDTTYLWEYEINGVLPINGKSTTFEELLGKPINKLKIDSDKECDLYWEKSDFKVFFKGVECESHKDSLFTRLINFEENSNLFIKVRSLKISYKTTLGEFKLIFPNIKTYPIGDKDSHDIAVEFSLGKNVDDKIILIFRNSKLVEFNYYIPC
jgi:hypothetical protein